MAHMALSDRLLRWYNFDLIANYYFNGVIDLHFITDCDKFIAANSNKIQLNILLSCTFMPLFRRHNVFFMNRDN